MTRCLEEIDSNRSRNAGVNLDEPIANYVAAFTLIRTRAGDRTALDEYAAWVRKTRPEELKYRANDCLEPMWRFPDEPAIREAARWLFNDPQSPWVPLLRAPGSDTNLLFHHTRLYASPLLCTAGFREGLLAAMAIKTEMGTVGRGMYRTIQYKTGRGWGENFQANQDDLESLKPGVALPFRVCDFIAWKVSSIEGSPRCELYWPEDRRDRAVAGVRGLLEEVRRSVHGRRCPPASIDFPGKQAHLAFPASEPAGDPRRRPRGPGDLLARRAGRGPPGERAGVPDQGPMGHARRIPGRPPASRRDHLPRVRPGRLDLAGRGGSRRQGGPVGPLLRVRRPSRDRTRPCVRDRAGPRSLHVGAAPGRPGRADRAGRAAPRRLRARQADPHDRADPESPRGRQRGADGVPPSGRGWPAGVAARGLARSRFFRRETFSGRTAARAFPVRS